MLQMLLAALQDLSATASKKTRRMRRPRRTSRSRLAEPVRPKFSLQPLGNQPLRLGAFGAFFCLRSASRLAFSCFLKLKVALRPELQSNQPTAPGTAGGRLAGWKFVVVLRQCKTRRITISCLLRFTVVSKWLQIPRGILLRLDIDVTS